MSRPDGGPAFPSEPKDWSAGYNELGERIKHGGSAGMSLRDYFAAKAMQVFCSDSEGFVDDQQRAEAAYAMADAMLAERSR